MTTPDRTQRLDALGKDQAPGRDLWPAIAAQIETQPARIRRPFRPWLPWAVTAGLAILVSGTWWLHRGGGALHGDPELAAFEPGDPELASERRRLAAELPAMLEALPLGARLGASQSLDAVREARAQIVAALRRDATDPELREWLLDNQQQELRVMQIIASAGEQTRTL